jgi:hypothetical protein
MLKFKTINIDGEIRNWEFEYIEDMLKNWWSDDCTLPANDDEVVFAEFNGEKIEAKVFEDIINEFRR